MNGEYEAHSVWAGLDDWRQHNTEEYDISLNNYILCAWEEVQFKDLQPLHSWILLFFRKYANGPAALLYKEALQFSAGSDFISCPATKCKTWHRVATCWHFCPIFCLFFTMTQHAVGFLKRMSSTELHKENRKEVTVVRRAGFQLEKFEGDKM